MLKLDTLTLVETPEAIDIVLRPAGLIPRALAFSLDFVIRVTWASISIPFILWIFGQKLGFGLIILNGFFIMWLYAVLFEVKCQGRTLGKMIMGLRVIHDDGTPIGFTASMLRNLLRVVDGLPLLYPLGSFVVCLHPESKRIGDIVAGTLVVYDDRKKQQLPIIPNVPALASPILLTKEEQKAFVNFAERSTKLAKDRQQELSEIISPTLGVYPYESVKTILGIARGIVGEKREDFKT